MPFFHIPQVIEATLSKVYSNLSEPLGLEIRWELFSSGDF